MDSYCLAFRIVGLPPMANASGRSRNFWAIKGQSDKWKAMVARELRHHELPRIPLTRAFARFTRYSAKEPDYDGLVHGFKPVCDALVKYGVLQDDKPSILTPAYRWEHVPVRSGFIEVVVSDHPL